MTPRLLALDGATETLHLALVLGAAVHTRRESGGAGASARLLPTVQDLLASHGVALRELDAIAFGRGPGAFTGVRTACAVVQGLAFGLGKPVLAIDTLLAVAEAARQQGAASPIWVAQDARMGELYLARYAWAEVADGIAWQTLQAPALVDARTLAAQWCTAPASIAGHGVTAHAEAFAMAPQLQYLQAEPHGAALAALALAAWRRGEAQDAAQASPLYVRDKVALTTAERAAARAALQPAKLAP